MKRDYEISNGEGVKIQFIVDDNFIQIITSTGQEYKFEYSAIKKGIQTKNLIILYSQAKLAYIIPKKAFIKGTAEEFIKFLQTKNIIIK